MLDISYHWGVCILFSLEYESSTFLGESSIDEKFYF